MADNRAPVVRSVTIFIPTHNRRDILARTLESLAAVRMPAGVAVDLLVVANACTDGTEAMVAEKVAALLPFPGRCVAEAAVGVSHARNRGAAEATGEIVAMLDDDVWVDPAWLEALLAVYESEPADLVAGRVELWWEAVERPAWVTPTVEGLLSRKDNGDRVIELKGWGEAISANLAVRRPVFAAVGGFRVGLGRSGGGSAAGVGAGLLAGEETDFIDRALRGGHRMFYAPDAAVKHWVAPHRIGRAYLSGISYQLGRSQVFMKDRFGPGDLLRCVVGRSWLVARNGAGELWAAARGDEANRVRHRLRRRIGIGGLAAAAQRLLGRSPVRSEASPS